MVQSPLTFVLHTEQDPVELFDPAGPPGEAHAVAGLRVALAHRLQLAAHVPTHRVLQRRRVVDERLDLPEDIGMVTITMMMIMVMMMVMVVMMVMMQRSFLCVCMHAGVAAHRQRVSTTFSLGKSFTNVSCAPEVG